MRKFPPAWLGSGKTYLKPQSRRPDWDGHRRAACRFIPGSRGATRRAPTDVDRAIPAWRPPRRPASLSPLEIPRWPGGPRSLHLRPCLVWEVALSVVQGISSLVRKRYGKVSIREPVIEWALFDRAVERRATEAILLNGCFAVSINGRASSFERYGLSTKSDKPEGIRLGRLLDRLAERLHGTATCSSYFFEAQR
jgi:hypothetical protein